MAFSSHYINGMSGNVQLGLGEELNKETEDQNSTQFILEENNTVKLGEPTETDEGGKIHRTRFTAFQKLGLEEAFALCQYVRSHECQILAERLGLNSKTVQVWFRNKRFKVRKTARQERQCYRNQPSSSNFSSRNTKFQELSMQQTSSPTHMFVDSRMAYVLHPPSPFLYTDDYLMAAGYSTNFTGRRTDSLYVPPVASLPIDTSYSVQ